MNNSDELSVSVIMPVFNTHADILKESVNSILNQTFTEFEFIIIDDFSTLSETEEYLNALTDPRISIIRNPKNLGITRSLNIAMRAAKGKYVARMDSDDISLPYRLEKQYSFMEEHPDTLICGSTVQFFGSSSFIWHTDTEDQELYRIRLLFRNEGPSHPSVMYRRESMLSHDLWYDESLQYAQDYMMWINASRIGKISCLDEVLLLYRVHAGQVRKTKAEAQRRCDYLIHKKTLSLLLDNVTLQDAETHFKYCKDSVITDEAYTWFMKLAAANDKKQVYDKEKFRTFIYDFISPKVYSTYNIIRRRPWAYLHLFKYLPASYIINCFIKKLTPYP